MKRLIRIASLTCLTLPVLSIADDGLMSTGLMQGWKRELDVGVNGSSGNSDSMNLHAGFKGRYEDTDKIWKFDTAYDSSSTDGDKSRNEFFADLQRDWLIEGSPWFGFAQGRYDWNEFKDWDYRLSGSGGAGYQFIKDETWNVSGRLGLGGNRTYGGLEDEFTTEALLALDAGWNISKRESVNFSTTFYPSLEKSGEYRNITTLDWKMTMGGEDSPLAMKIGLKNEFDSQAAPGIEESDFTYFLSLVWGI